MKVSIDTNVLIDTPEIVFDDSREFVIPFMVVRELDKLKRNPDLKRAAQAAIRNIWTQYSEGKLEILDVPSELADSPDEIIIESTKKAGASLLSGDIGARIIAKAHGVEVSGFEAESAIDWDYKGHVTVKGTVNYEQDFVQIKEMQLLEFNEQFDVDLKENMYCIVDRVVDKDDIWVNKLGTVTRISQSLRPYKDAGVLIGPMDNEQWCALHAVSDPDVPLTVIDGRLGTGKTLMALAGALYATTGRKTLKQYEKIVVSKPPISTNRDLYTGFKPGSTSEKMSGHLGGIKSNLKFMLDKKGDKAKVDRDGNVIETIAGQVWDEFFTIVELDEVQGTSMHDNIWILDEWQLIDEDTAKLAMSRLAGGSKLVLVGDTVGQTYGTNRANEGFKPLFEWFGKAPEFNYVKLENIYRSPLAEFVAKVYE